MNRTEAIDQAAEQIKRICPDIGGQMVLAAFAQDSIDREFPPKQPTAKGETMHELTPCAECGNDQALLSDSGGPLTGQLFWVECFKCGHKTPTDRSAVTVITFWNQEAPRGSSGTLANGV